MLISTVLGAAAGDAGAEHRLAALLAPRDDHPTVQ